MTSQLEILTEVARQAMFDRGLEPDFPDAVQQELSAIEAADPPSATDPIRDLRQLLWFSIDNDDSKDLDQLTFVETFPNQESKVYVAIADVDILVKRDDAIDKHAAHNTTSIYTPSKVFSMLPEKLSTDLTSLNPDEDRHAMIVETTIDTQGAIKAYAVYPAYIHSKAKLAYNGVTAWLDGKAPPPQPIENKPELQKQLHLHDEIAKKIKLYRQNQGELTLEIAEFQLVISNDRVEGLQELKKNRARQLIETLMISANTAATRFLMSKGYPIVKRVVSAPKRWDRIVALAQQSHPGTQLPNEPDSKALERFLLQQRSADPLNFPELSLTVIKSLGRGEYKLSRPGEEIPEGHFALALQDYSHITAPNRRYLDLVIQRMLKAAIAGKPCPYGYDDLDAIAQYCTIREVDAEKIERRVKKSAAAMLLSSEIGATYEGIITGAGPYGTWVKVFNPAVEGKLVRGFEGVDVGDHVHVKLLHVDMRQGFIDFAAT